MGEQRYKAVMAVLSDGRTVTEVARDWDVSRQTMHAWLARYERDGMAGMGDRSHRPTRCPHQMAALIEVRVLEMRRHKPFWGPRRLALEWARKGVTPTPSASAIYRGLLRAGLIWADYPHLQSGRRRGQSPGFRATEHLQSAPASVRPARARPGDRPAISP